MSFKITFVDVESTGLDKAFSQVISFFGRTVDLLTGKILDEIDESCCINSYHLPSPEALLINRYPIENLKKGQKCHEMLHKVHGYIQRNSPQTIVCHNASFDYAMIHNGYYHHLITPNIYHFRTDGNNILCTKELARAITGFSKNKDFVIAKNSFGHPSFVLGDLCRANGINIENAHTSEGDTKAMIKIFELLRKSNIDIFKQTLFCSKKINAAKFINQNPIFYAALGTHENFRVRPLTALAMNHDEVICADVISEEFEDVSLLTDSYFNSLLGSDISLHQPILRLRLNKGICLMGEGYQDMCEETLNVDSRTLFKRASELRRTSLLTSLAKRNLGNYVDDPKKVPVPEQRIYSDGFPNIIEKSFINAFNSATPLEKIHIKNEYKKKLDPENRFICLANRSIAENHPEILSKFEKEEYFKWYNDRLFVKPTEQEHPWMTLHKALDEIERLKLDYPDQIKRLNEIREFFFREAAFSGHSVRDLFFRDTPQKKFLGKINDKI